MYVSTPVLSSSCFKTGFLIVGPLISSAVTSAELCSPWRPVSHVSNRLGGDCLLIGVSGKTLKEFQRGISKHHRFCSRAELDGGFALERKRQRSHFCLLYGRGCLASPPLGRDACIRGLQC